MACISAPKFQSKFTMSDLGSAFDESTSHQTVDDPYGIQLPSKLAMVGSRTVELLIYTVPVQESSASAISPGERLKQVIVMSLSPNVRATADSLSGALDRWISAVRTELGLTATVRYSRNELNALAQAKPGELVRLIERGSLYDVDLSFAAEALADSPQFVVQTIMNLLSHGNPLVREGALYGLAGHLTEEGVKEAIQIIAETDQSEGVRSAAQDVLS